VVSDIEHYLSLWYVEPILSLNKELLNRLQQDFGADKSQHHSRSNAFLASAFNQLVSLTLSHAIGIKDDRQLIGHIAALKGAISQDVQPILRKLLERNRDNHTIARGRTIL
jgi:hypothetical protein